jgi:immunity protein 27 of polymorphic toxin system
LNLKPIETDLTGQWAMIDGQMMADDTSARIDWLVKHALTEIATDFSGWDVLYRDPKDGRYWELTYPQSEMHGGGPPRLRYMPDEEAKKKYGIGER